MSIHTIVEIIDSTVSPHKEDPKLSWELHHLLSDDFDFSGDYWLFEKEGIRAFVDKLIVLHDESLAGITFAASWSPDDIDQNREITMAEIEELFITNQLHRTTKYIVRKLK